MEGVGGDDIIDLARMPWKACENGDMEILEKRVLCLGYTNTNDNCIFLMNCPLEHYVVPLFML